MFIPRLTQQVPFLTAGQMREVDRLMVEDYGALLLPMMENAGRALARLSVDRFFAGTTVGKKVLVLAGKGGNGGGGLACARRLHAWGVEIEVWTAWESSKIDGVAGSQLGMLRKFRVPVQRAAAVYAWPQVDLVVDALIGYGLKGPPIGLAAELIRRVTRNDVPVVALDVPSGVDSTSGEVWEPSIKAEATLTMALPKMGLKNEKAREAVGELYLADIGVPPELYRAPSLGLKVGPIFAKADILRLW